MSHAKNTDAEFQCPGEEHPISRAVHLGRLARFYPACRECPRRNETGLLSPRQVKRLQETANCRQQGSLFQREEVGGVALGQLPPGTVRDVAIAFGLCLQRGLLPAPAASAGDAPPDAAVVVAGDGRPAAAELLAAACDGLRFAGCHVLDLGAASAPCLMFAADHLGAAGGLLIGSGQNGLKHASVKLFGPAATPLSEDAGLDVVRRQWEHGIDRPSRRFGGIRRFQAETPYLARFRDHYHALRPLRFVLDGSCLPVERSLGQLLAGLACEATIVHAGGANLPERVVADEAHFGIHVDDDGERCRLVDERGEWVAATRLLAILATQPLAGEAPGAVLLAPGDLAPGDSATCPPACEGA
ncbi:MAG: hypothetical protein U1E05_04385, partial [Patescibacteria group bacterium]|nr:hypothetical protein [Patescibacteria group bacterium]